MKTKAKQQNFNFWASGGSSAIEFKAQNMKEAIQKASLSFVCNYQNKVSNKENLILEFRVGKGKLPEDW